MCLIALRNSSIFYIFLDILLEMVNKHAPRIRKYVRGNHYLILHRFFKNVSCVILDLKIDSEIEEIKRAREVTIRRDIFA